MSWLQEAGRKLGEAFGKAEFSASEALYKRVILSKYSRWNVTPFNDGTHPEYMRNSGVRTYSLPFTFDGKNYPAVTSVEPFTPKGITGDRFTAWPRLLGVFHEGVEGVIGDEALLIEPQGTDLMDAFGGQPKWEVFAPGQLFVMSRNLGSKSRSRAILTETDANLFANSGGREHNDRKVINAADATAIDVALFLSSQVEIYSQGRVKVPTSFMLRLLTMIARDETEVANEPINRTKAIMLSLFGKTEKPVEAVKNTSALNARWAMLVDRLELVQHLRETPELAAAIIYQMFPTEGDAFRKFTADLRNGEIRTWTDFKGYVDTLPVLQGGTGPGMAALIFTAFSGTREVLERTTQVPPSIILGMYGIRYFLTVARLTKSIIHEQMTRVATQQVAASSAAVNFAEQYYRGVEATWDDSTAALIHAFGQQRPRIQETAARRAKQVVDDVIGQMQAPLGGFLKTPIESDPTQGLPPTYKDALKRVEPRNSK